jgi:hypothetical protein
MINARSLIETPMPVVAEHGAKAVVHSVNLDSNGKQLVCTG